MVGPEAIVSEGGDINTKTSRSPSAGQELPGSRSGEGVVLGRDVWEGPSKQFWRGQPGTTQPEKKCD